MFYPGEAGQGGGEGFPFYPGPNGPGGFIPYPANGGQGGEGGAFFPGGQGMYRILVLWTGLWHGVYKISQGFGTAGRSYSRNGIAFLGSKFSCIPYYELNFVYNLYTQKL